MKLFEKLNPKNQKGNVLVIFLLSMAIATLAVFSFYYTRNSAFIANSVLQTTSANIQVMQSNLVGMLNNPLAWAETYKAAANGNLIRCMTDLTFDCPRSSTPLVMMNGLGDVYYDATAGTTGFTNTATICSRYGLADNAGCQLRFTVTWTPECPPNGTCIMPSIVVNMDLVMTGYTGVYSINPEPYRYVLRIN